MKFLVYTTYTSDNRSTSNIPLLVSDITELVI